MFEKTKKYFEEHPEVKKGLIIASKVAGAMAFGFAAYKVGKSVGSKKTASLPEIQESKPYVPEIETLTNTLVNEPLPKYGMSIRDLRDDIPIVPDKHSYDMSFKDLTTGDVYTAKDSCLGYYVNDVLGSFADTQIEISVEKALQDASV